MSSDKIVIYMNDKRFDGAFEHFVNKVYEAGAASVQKELEATKAELAVERAKPKCGVAWAVKNRKCGTLDGWEISDGRPILHETKESAEKWIAGSEDRWEVVPYPLGDGADELKAAIERVEKAENEVAAWKEAATHRDQSQSYTPSMLKSRIDNLRDTADRLIDELAALKAAPAEVPPLDKWRVLATAKRIATEGYSDSPYGSPIEVVYACVKDGARSLLMRFGKSECANPYPLKD